MESNHVSICSFLAAILNAVLLPADASLTCAKLPSFILALILASSIATSSDHVWDCSHSGKSLSFGNRKSDTSDIGGTVLGQSQIPGLLISQYWYRYQYYRQYFFSYFWQYSIPILLSASSAAAAAAQQRPRHNIAGVCPQAGSRRRP